MSNIYFFRLQVGVALASERRISKGPAPPPPVVANSNQGIPIKKGPAPAVPSGSPAAAKGDAPPSASVATDTNPEAALDNSTPPSTAEPDSSLPTTPLSAPATPTEPPALIATQLSPLAPRVDSFVTTSTTAIIATLSDKHIPEESESSPRRETVSISLLEADTRDVIDAIPVAKSVVVFDADATIGVVPSTQVSVGEKASENRPSSQNKDQNGSSPVTLSVVTPATSEEAESQSSDVLLASISSEGTVIVRTPTPTSTAVTSQSETTQQAPASTSDSVVTYTGEDIR